VPLGKLSLSEALLLKRCELAKLLVVGVNAVLLTVLSLSGMPVNTVHL